MKKYIGLLTDFGIKDYFVGVLHGVIKQINPEVEIFDIAHGVTSHYTLSAAFIAEKNFKFFPYGTIFIVVVDPGVGTDRNIILVSYDRYYFIAPDNGVLTPFLSSDDKVVRIIDADHYFLSKDSSTFEARDRMAPIAAYLSRGTEPSRLGTETDDYIIDNSYFPKIKGTNIIEGKIVYVDKFGNIITNFTKDFIFNAMGGSSFTKFKIKINGQEITDFVKVYAQGKTTPFMLFGSHGNLEIAMNKKPAYKTLKVGLNQTVELNFY